MKVLHIYSGGLDSTVLLHQLIAQCQEVECVNFNYGSNHNDMERTMACLNVKRLGLNPIIEVPLAFVKNLFTSSLLSGAETIPEGHYQEETMRSTVVPFRNGILIAIAAGIAESNGCDMVSYGAHAGDHYIYPDCRPQFIDAMSDAVREGTEKQIKLHAPFYNMTKGDVVSMGSILGVNFKHTYSCYKGNTLHCGVCGACNERKEAFKEVGVKDPTEYQS